VTVQVFPPVSDAWAPVVAPKKIESSRLRLHPCKAKSWSSGTGAVKTGANPFCICRYLLVLIDKYFHSCWAKKSTSHSLTHSWGAVRIRESEVIETSRLKRCWTSNLPATSSEAARPAQPGH